MYGNIVLLCVLLTSFAMARHLDAMFMCRINLRASIYLSSLWSICKQRLSICLSVYMCILIYMCLCLCNMYVSVYAFLSFNHAIYVPAYYTVCTFYGQQWWQKAFYVLTCTLLFASRSLITPFLLVCRTIVPRSLTSAGDVTTSFSSGQMGTTLGRRTRPIRLATECALQNTAGNFSHGSLGDVRQRINLKWRPNLLLGRKRCTLYFLSVCA